jgi:protein O-GlcNAc transferase
MITGNPPRPSAIPHAKEIELQGWLARADLHPQDREAVGKGATLALEIGRFTHAADLASRFAQLEPRHPYPFFLLGLSLEAQGDWPGALAAFLTSARLGPGGGAALVRSAHLLIHLGRHSEASRKIQEVLDQDSKSALDAETLRLAAMALHLLGDHGSARDWLLTALARGGGAQVHDCLGVVQLALQAPDEALEHFEAAVALDPSMATAQNNLGYALLLMGDWERGWLHTEEALDLAPTNPRIVLNALFYAHAGPGQGLEQIYRHTLKVVEGAFPRVTTACFPGTDPDPDRRIRIGYLSPDFRTHAMAHWISPLLEHRNRAAFEVTCFAEELAVDEETRQFKTLADRWVSTEGSSAEEVARQIRDIEIDILVDLAGHTTGGRLDVLALKPAPVQVSMLGFDRTTGLRSVDWRISNPITDPPGDSDRWTTERFWRLNGPFGFRPLPEAPEIKALPALVNGHVTFGFLGNPARVGRTFLLAAARLLARVPGSRLVLLCRPGEDEAHKKFKRGIFREAGGDPERLIFKPRVSPEARFLGYYHDVDISLNSFPAEGGTTICESLWMGVPVLVLDRAEAVRHTGRGLLTHVGMADWVAADLEAWLRMAERWSHEIARLAALRSGLRRHLATTPVFDAAKTLPELEAAYRGMWRHYCEGRDLRG